MLLHPFFFFFFFNKNCFSLLIRTFRLRLTKILKTYQEHTQAEGQLRTSLFCSFFRGKYKKGKRNVKLWFNRTKLTLAAFLSERCLLFP